MVVPGWITSQVHRSRYRTQGDQLRGRSICPDGLIPPRRLGACFGKENPVSSPGAHGATWRWGSLPPALFVRA